MRGLSEAEVASVVEARRASDPTGISAERFSAPGASYILAYLEPPTDQWADDFQLERERVPLYWDARLLPPAGADVGEGVVTAELSDLPPSEVPPISCVSTPTLNTFCPYDTTTSNTRPAVNCTASLVGQVTAAESSFSPPIAGIDYYRTVNLGMTGGPTPRPIWGVRVGREPNGSLPVVRQLVVVAGQHGNEWEPIEMARRLVFYYATMYKLGDATVRSLLDQQAILFIPALNPDGYQFSHSSSRAWRANRNLCQSSPTEFATDLNRNFPFAWGSDNIGSSPSCTSSTFRGGGPASEAETNVLLNAVTAGGYRTVALLNLHSYAGALYHNAGFSTGSISSPSTAVCLDPSNCINPDLGLGELLMGTERAPFLRHPALTTLPYATGQGLSLTYSGNGILDQTAQYGALPNGAPNFQASTIELRAPCYGLDEQSPPSLRDQQEADLRALINNHLTRLPAVAGATTPAFDLPLMQRRNVAPHAAAEPLTLRVAVRNGVSGVSITNLAPVTGTTSLDDIRPGAFYTEYRWRPTSAPWIFPSRSFVCATGQTCRVVTLDAATTAATVNLCDSTRFTAGSGWTWSGASCDWTLDQPGTLSNLTSTFRDLTRMRQSHLVFSFRRKSNLNGAPPPSVVFDIEVSSNGFVGCSPANFGVCRRIRRVGGDYGVAATPNANYVTVITDVSDFDGLPNVQMRIRVRDNPNSSCGDTECRGAETMSSCPADCPEPLPRTPRLRIYDPMFVGWYQ